MSLPTPMSQAPALAEVAATPTRAGPIVLAADTKQHKMRLVTPQVRVNPLAASALEAMLANTSHMRVGKQSHIGATKAQFERQLCVASQTARLAQEVADRVAVEAIVVVEGDGSVDVRYHGGACGLEMQTDQGENPALCAIECGRAPGEEGMPGLHRSGHWW